MNSLQISGLKFGNLLIIVIVMQIAMYVTVLFDVAVARQIVGFLFLIFVPGIVILKLMKLKDLDSTETVIVSVGLSIAFLMFIGLLINEFGPMVGTSKPLSQWPLIIIINVAVLLMCLLGYVTNREDFDINITVAKGSSVRSLFRIGLFVFLPFLSVAGTLLASVYQNNVLLLLMIITISILVVLSIVSNRLVPSKFHSLVLLMIAIALLFHAALISDYIYGYDINVEYYTFNLTKSNSYWNSTINADSPEYDKINAMLSLTVLPTVFSSILNMSATWILKIVYPLIFSFVPLGLYQLYKGRKWGEKVAFVSTFFFVATSAFFTEMLGLARQMIAEFFFVLLLFVLFNDKINPRRKGMLFIIFSAALAVSHYSLSYIFMFYISFTWLSVYILRKRTIRITASMVVMLFAILFSWYIYVSASAPFTGLLYMGENVLTSTTEFLDPASRGQEVLRGLGVESAPSWWHLLGRIFAYATEFLIIVGFIALIARRKKRFLAAESEYVVTLSLSMMILISCIAVPGVASGLNMTRYYHIVIILLSPLCILGGKTLLGFFARGRMKTESLVLILLLILLVPYFLFQTGFVYEVTGDSSWSIPLSKYRMGLMLYTMGYIDEQDVFGAIWLSERMNTDRTMIYADDMARNSVLSSYGMIRRDRVEVLLNTTTIRTDDVIYLRRMNLVYGALLSQRWNVESAWNITEISSILDNMNTVYSNGGCEIYRAIINQTG
ncbi:MAG: DUF2206 domain-containing protein [Promethearchaeota archaeon]